MKGMVTTKGTPMLSTARYHVGIDPGTHTGVAIWDRWMKDRKGGFVAITSMEACKVEHLLTEQWAGLRMEVHIHVEDTRNLVVPKNRRIEDTPGKLQGVGMVKRDMARWEEWLRFHGWGFTMRTMMHKHARRISAEDFRKLTGWTERTNEHGRAAAMLVFGQ